MQTFRLALLLTAAGVSLAGCNPGLGYCLHADCSTIDAIAAEVYLCGFPGDQLGSPGSLTVPSFIRPGQRLELRLMGDLDRIQTIQWEASARNPRSVPPVVRLTPTSRTTAVLEGISPGGDSLADDVFVGAPLTFKDGTEATAPLAYCGGGSRIPVGRLVVSAGP